MTVTAVLAGGLVAATAGVAGADHAVSLSQSTGVLDKQKITVSWSGAEPNGNIGIFQCKSTESANGTCEIREGFPASTSFPSDANGAGSVQYEVHRNYDGEGACQTTCYIKVNQPGHEPVAAVAEFTFGDAPPGGGGGGGATTTSAPGTATTVPDNTPDDMADTGLDVPTYAYIAAALLLVAVAAAVYRRRMVSRA